MCCNANGAYLPLYVIYEGKTVDLPKVSNGPPDCRYVCTENGWMDTSSFEDRFESIFLNYTKKRC